MGDNRHAGAFRGKPPQDSRLAAVGVDKVRFLFLQDGFQLSQRHPVLLRMDGTDQFGNSDKIFGRSGKDFARHVFERAFRADGRAGNQIYLKVWLLAQGANRGEGVFLRAADDETGYDVGDAHGAFSVARP